MRIPLSGYNDEALTTTVKEIISGEDFDGDGVVFWLRGVAITNEHATETALVDLFDQDEAAVTAANQRGSVQCPAKATTVVDFPAPGIAFKTNIGAVVTDGTVNAYGVVACGYKE
ncbi:hypothetical protein ES703_100508 [subsurface metagenome]